MTDEDRLRGAVAAQLIAMSAPGHPLHTDADHNTNTLYAGDVHRFAFRKRVVAEYLDRQSPVRGGRSAVVSAGAPGAGKSTALREHAADLTGFRILDPDIVKDYLIERAMRDGVYDDILARPLGDGRTVAPRELAALVHHESTRLIDQIRRICITRRENIVVEGTLTWKGQAPKLVAEFTEGDYQSVEVIAVEADRPSPTSRPCPAGGQAAGGGRTARTGSAAASPRRQRSTSATRDTAQSLCAQHAVELEDLASAGDQPPAWQSCAATPPANWKRSSSAATHIPGECLVAWVRARAGQIWRNPHRSTTCLWPSSSTTSPTESDRSPRARYSSTVSFGLAANAGSSPTSRSTSSTGPDPHRGQPRARGIRQAPCPATSP
ncbi:hypothetical protein GCM10023094_00280 [Rhodococcus olei]|uniref:UDP-N-acetylglucosamine kinase n=1 Tax=Rhodococcus olei TaxID=2161675 RepID=A0ABP8NTL5_9NOCA